MKFRGWYIPIWIAGLSCLIAGFVSEWYLIIFGIALIALPFILWFVVKPKKQKETKPEIPVEPINAEEKEEPKYERLSFEVENVREHQSVLKKANKIKEEGEIWDAPSCVMYTRGTPEEPSFAVYLDHDRIGDAEESKCREIYDFLGKGELSSIHYDIDTQFDDELDDLLYSCTITLVIKLQ